MGLVGAIAFSLLLSHGFSTPIEDLVKGTSEIQRGNFGIKVPVRSRDEIGRLTQSFNETRR
ncbi:MAG: HAMP domain-containing protein [Verrucomicrobia bacterium]|nr:HAMP domain-containing protein [Verrucomicrobiota bacterium]